MEDSKRVVITGVGMISSLGVGKENFQSALFEGKSGISKITSFDTSAFDAHYGGEIKNFHAADFIPEKKLKLFGRATQFAIAALSLAVKDAKLSLEKINKEKTGLIIGNTTGDTFLEDSFEALARKDRKNLKKYKISHLTVDNISSSVAFYFHITGPSYIISTACAAGNYAIGYGMDLIRRGKLDFVLAGGADFFSKSAFIGFHRLYAMAPKLCQPFDKNRKGMLLGEGCGILLLESLQSARKRKADIYAEIIGYGLSCDAYHVVTPSEVGIERAMRKAINNANIEPENIDYICAHGTGTISNDKAECVAIKKIFDKKYKKIPVSSIKSMIGHAMAAASSIEAISCCLAIKKGMIPPTINYKRFDPECDIDCVPNRARKKEIDIALNNSFAFGGNNCCVIFKKVV